MNFSKVYDDGSCLQVSYRHFWHDYTGLNTKKSAKLVWRKIKHFFSFELKGFDYQAPICKKEKDFDRAFENHQFKHLRIGALYYTPDELIPWDGQYTHLSGHWSFRLLGASIFYRFKKQTTMKRGKKWQFIRLLKTEQ